MGTDYTENSDASARRKMLSDTVSRLGNGKKGASVKPRGALSQSISSAKALFDLSGELASGSVDPWTARKRALQLGEAKHRYQVKRAEEVGADATGENGTIPTGGSYRSSAQTNPLGVRFTGAGGTPFRLDPHLPGAVSVHALSEMRAREAAEQGAYRAIKQAERDAKEAEARAKSDWLWRGGGYQAMKNHEAEIRLRNALSSRLTAQMNAAADALERGDPTDEEGDDVKVTVSEG